MVSLDLEFGLLVMAAWLVVWFGIVSALIKEKNLYEIVGAEDYKLFLDDFKENIRVISVYSFNPTGKNELNSLFFQLSNIAKNEDRKITFAKLDRSNNKNKEIVKELNIGSNQAIYFLSKSNTPNIYRGPKTRDLMDYLLKKYHQLHEFSSVSEVKDLIMDRYYYEGLVLGAFDANDLEAKSSFINFSHHFSHLYSFGLINYSEALHEEFQINQSSIIACRGPGLISFNDDYYKSTSNLTDLHLEDWVKTHIHPNIGFYTKERESSLTFEVPLIRLVIDLKDRLRVEHMIDMISLTSKHYFTDDFYERRYRWGLSDRAEYIDELVNDGLDHLQMVYYVRDKQNLYVIDEDIYKGNGEFNETGLRRFYKKYAAKDLSPFVRKAVDKRVENGIVVASSLNIAKIVAGEETQIVYVYKEIGKNLKVVEELAQGLEVEVVKIDKSKARLKGLVESDLDELLLILRKGKKDAPEVYKGEWNAKQIKKYLKVKEKGKADL